MNPARPIQNELNATLIRSVNTHVKKIATSARGSRAVRRGIRIP